MTSSESLDLRSRIARVYDHITHGRISKPDTDYRAVLAEADECVQRQIDAAVAEALSERTCQEVSTKPPSPYELNLLRHRLACGLLFSPTTSTLRALEIRDLAKALADAVMSEQFDQTAPDPSVWG